MKYMYLSPRDFEKNCPCSYHLDSYAQLVSPPSALIDFTLCHLEKSFKDEEKYIATYCVILPNHEGCYDLEVSCTILPDGSYNYETLRKTDIRQK